MSAKNRAFCDKIVKVVRYANGCTLSGSTVIWKVRRVFSHTVGYPVGAITGDMLMRGMQENGAC